MLRKIPASEVCHILCPRTCRLTLELSSLMDIELRDVQSSIEDALTEFKVFVMNFKKANAKNAWTIYDVTLMCLPQKVFSRVQAMGFEQVAFYVGKHNTTLFTCDAREPPMRDVAFVNHLGISLPFSTGVLDTADL